MICAQQGDILWLEQEEQYVLVLSREFFNQSGMSVVCPLRDNAKPDALHIGIFSDAYNGTALLEHLRSLDLQARHYRKISRLEHLRSLDLQARHCRKISSISYEQVQDISDAVQGIFDYYPYSTYT